MKKLLILISLSLVNLTCNLGGGCGDSDKPLPYFNINNLSSILISMQPQSGVKNSYLSGTSVKTTDKIYFDVFYKVDFYANKVKESSFNIIATANACSPIEPGYKGSNEKYKKLTISSDADFTTGFPAGSDLNSFFEISNSQNNYVPLSSNNLENSQVASAYLSVRLVQNPSLTKKHKFKITVELTNGEKYEKSSEEIVFQ